MIPLRPSVLRSTRLIYTGSYTVFARRLQIWSSFYKTDWNLYADGTTAATMIMLTLFCSGTAMDNGVSDH